MILFDFDFMFDVEIWSLFGIVGVFEGFEDLLFGFEDVFMYF